MKISDYLVKKQWSRRVLGHNSSYIETNPKNNVMRKPSGKFEVFSQDRFLNEIHSGSHIIFDCNHRSMRPKYKYDLEKNANVLDGYEDVTRMAVSWQEAIRSNKTATCGGNPLWIGNENEDASSAEKVAKIKSHINTFNLQAALLQHFYTIFGTADGALYFYRDGDNICWECFSYEDGDNCTERPDYENPNVKMGVRYFDYEGFDAVEFYRTTKNELFIQFPDEDEMRKHFPNAIGTITEDGYYLISSVIHGLDESLFCYHRERDIPSGPVQKNIEDFESLLSDCGENIKYYAYQILFLSGGAMSLPNANFGGKVIGSKTADGDAKILEPADASNTLDIGFKKVYNAICDGSKSVFIKPDELKGQNDSGAYIANLYWPELQWATLFYSRYSKCLTKVLRVIKKLVGQIEGDLHGYSQIKLSYMFDPYIPKNKLEQSTILQQGVTAGFISIETATEESDSANPQEVARLETQALKRIERERMLNNE
jgi:hypothetical protein